MSIRTFIANIRQLARGDVVTFNASRVTDPAFTGGNISDMLSVPGSGRPAESCIVAYACITARREAVAGAPLMLTDVQDRVIESGPVWQLLQNPNGSMDWGQWVRVLETHLSLYNACAVAPIGGDQGRLPEALDALHPAGLMPVMGVYEPTGTPRILRWQYTDPTTGQTREFGPDDVVVHVGYNPHSPLSALSPVNVLKRTILADIASREQNLGLFHNDATPRGYLHSDQMMTPEQADEVLKKWNSTQQGYLNRHKTAATWGGLKYDRVQLSPAELEFLESLKAMRIDFYMAFRVYPAMLAEMTGETGLSQGSSTDEQRVAWWEDVGIPELNLIAGLHQRILNRSGVGLDVARRSERALNAVERRSLERAAARKRGGELQLWFNDAAIPALVRHRAARIDGAVKLATVLGYRPDDASDYLNLGLPPHPDNEGRIPFSLATIGQETLPPPAEPAQRAEPGTQAVDRLEELLRAEAQRRNAKREVFDRILARLERQSADRWSRFFLEQRKRVLQRMENIGLARAAGDEWMKGVFPRADEDGQLVARLGAIWAEQAVQGWNLTNDELGLKRDENPLAIDDERVKRIVETRTIQGLKVNDTTEDALREILRDWAENGLTQSELTDRIAGYYRDNCVGADKVRPQTAARTQTAGIVNDGRLLAAQEVGGLRKYWIHGGSAEPRETHLEAARAYSEASAIPLAQKFVVGGEEMTAPGDSDATVGNTANCSCMLGLAKERR